MDAALADILAGPEAQQVRSEVEAELRLHQLGASGAQVVCATHSPVLASTPGADIIEIGDHGFRRTLWDDLELVDHWRRYMANPAAYLRHIIP